MKGVPFLSKKVYKRVRGWTLGQSLPVYNFLEYPPRYFCIYISILFFLHLALITELLITEEKIILSSRGAHLGRLVLCPLIELYIMTAKKVETWPSCLVATDPAR